MGQASRYIALFPEVPPEVQELRSACDPLAEIVSPHLTLVFPFVSDVADDRILAHLESCLPIRSASTGIRLHGITAHGEHLFLNVKSGNDTLISLHDRLYTGLFALHLSPLFTFIPHLTVGRRPADDVAAVALLAAWNQVGIDALITEADACLIRTDDNRPDLVIGMIRCHF